MFTTQDGAVTPNRDEVRISCAALAARMSDLLGTQPVQVQSPPMRSFSIRRTRAPSFAANRAAMSPPAPAPITAKSCGFVISNDGLGHQAGVCPISVDLISTAHAGAAIDYG